MHFFELSKFSPAERLDRAARDRQWCEATQLGGEFEGKTFEAADYLAVEEELIEAILEFFDASGLPHLRMGISEPWAGSSYSLDEYREQFSALYDPSFEQVVFRDDRPVTREELPIVLKMVLRQINDCSLQFDRHFHLFAGDDTIVEIATNKPPKNLPSFKHIFCVEFPGPGTYMPKGDIEVLVDIARKDDEFVSESDLTFLSHISRRQLRDLLGVCSDEHPFVTAFALTEEMAEKLASVTDYKFDFANYSYSISTYGNQY